MLGGGFFDVAVAEDFVFGAGVGGFEVGHVFDDAEDGDVHHFCHFDGFGDDHGDEFLGRGDDDDACDGEGLEDGEGDVAGAGGHVD